MLFIPNAHSGHQRMIVAIVRTGKALFAGMTAGKVNAMAAALRGALVPQGNLALIVSFQRLFPGPAASRAKAGPGSGERSTR